MKIPLHGKQKNRSIHRQMMFSATGGKGFRADFMERTVRLLDNIPKAFFRPELSKRQLKKLALREAYWRGVERYGV